MASIVLAAGVTIGAVIGAITNSLKAMSERAKSGRVKCGFVSPPAERFCCFVPFQDCRAGHRLSGRAHLAADSGGYSFPGGALFEKAVGPLWMCFAWGLHPKDNSFPPSTEWGHPTSRRQTVLVPPFQRPEQNSC